MVRTANHLQPDRNWPWRQHRDLFLVQMLPLDLKRLTSSPSQSHLLPGFGSM